MNVPLDQVIAYVLTGISLTMFIVEKRKNNKEHVYMSLQGLLKSAYVKFKTHNANFGLLIQHKLEKTERPVSLEEHALYVQLVALDYEAQMESLLGVMKSLEIKNDRIFNKNDFTGHDQFMKEIQNRNQSLQQSEIKSS
jgi:hypothetical protein